MLHISDGELHAVLDGALEELGPVRGAEVRSHLEGCHACGLRLEEERRLRAEATTILGDAVPSALEVPPFEEILTRADTVDARPSSRSAYGRYGWAASVVLALGVGWWAGRLPPVGGPSLADRLSLPSTEGVPSAPITEVRASAEPSGARGAESMAAFERDALVPADSQELVDAAERVASADVAPPPPGQARVAELPSPAEQAAAGAAIARGAAALAANARAAASGDSSEAAVTTVALAAVDSAVVRADSADLRGAEARLARVAVDTTGEASRTLAPLPAAEMRLRAFRGRPALEDGSLSPESRDSLLLAISGSGAGSLAIPDWPVLSVEWVQFTPTLAGVRVRQQIPGDSAVVEVLQGGFTITRLADGLGRTAGAEQEAAGASAAPYLVIPLPDGVRQAGSVRDGGRWVVVRARLSETELQSILSRLR